MPEAQAVQSAQAHTRTAQSTHERQAHERQEAQRGHAKPPCLQRPQASALRVRRLDITHFRNIQQLRVEPAPGISCLTGPNGAGKTSILESLSWLVPGRGLRNVPAQACIQDTHPAWAVAAELHGRQGLVRVGVGCEATTARRSVRIDGKNASGKTLLQHIAVVWLAPQMESLFTSSRERRSFLDRLIHSLDPDHSALCHNYDLLLRRRTRLLSQSAHSAWLDTIEQQLAQKAIAITAKRRTSIALLNHAAQTPPFPAINLDLQGAVEERLSAGLSALETEDWMAQQLRADRPDNALSGRTNTGPHRSAIHIRLQNRPAELCSSGEQTMILTAITLAHIRMMLAECNLCPVVLLDDIAAHLDGRHQAMLFESLQDLPAQTLLSSVEPLEALPSETLLFHVQDGRIIKPCQDLTRI